MDQGQQQQVHHLHFSDKKQRTGDQARSHCNDRGAEDWSQGVSGDVGDSGQTLVGSGVQGDQVCVAARLCACTQGQDDTEVTGGQHWLVLAG